MSKKCISPVDNTATQHEGTEHLAVKNTFLRRLLTRFALKTTARLYRRQGLCVPISKNLIVKMGHVTHLAEAATLEFVTAKTSIPVPRVHCAFVHRNYAYIVMERVKGITMAEAWPKLSEAGRDKIFSQLKDMVQELRNLQPAPNTGIESCTGGSLHDSRIPRARPRFGPFKTTGDFHLWLRDNFRIEDCGENVDEQFRNDLQHMIAMQDRPYPPPVFTHGDLNPFNILVHGEQVVSLIDWEFGGWYPNYWEYTAAWYTNVTRQAWQKVLPKFLDPYPEELKMELTRQVWWGDFFLPLEEFDDGSNKVH